MGALLSCTGHSIRTPGCQGTEWVSLNLTHQLTTPIPGPMQANRDSNEYPCQNISKLILLNNVFPDTANIPKIVVVFDNIVFPETFKVDTNVEGLLKLTNVGGFVIAL